MAHTIAKKDLLSYGIFAMPLAFAGIPLYIHAPDFYATQYGVSLASLGMVLLVLRFIDAIQDPLIGFFSDRYSIKRPLIMLMGSILLAVSFVLLFKPFATMYLIWFAASILLATTAFSILTINLNTLGGLWSRNKNQKTLIAGYREAFGLVGLILAVILPSVLQGYMPKEQAFTYVSIMLVCLIFLSLIFFGKWQEKYLKINDISSVNVFSFKDVVNLPKPAKQFFLIYGISMLASSIPAVLVLFFIRDYLNLENYTGLFLLTYFLSGAFGIAIWNQISKKIGKHKTWSVAMSLAVLSFIWAYFLNAGDFWPYLIICIMSGIAFGGELVLPSSILADHIQDSKKEKNAALYFGILALLAKFSLALAAAVTLVYLDKSGLKAGQYNTSYALNALTLSYALLPCLIKIISTYLLWRLIHEKNNSNINRSSDYA